MPDVLDSAGRERYECGTARRSPIVHRLEEDEIMAHIVGRRWSVAVLLMGLASMAPGTSAAGTDLGQFCFNLAPLPDTIRLSATDTGGPHPMISVAFRWRFLTSAQVAGAGVITESLLTEGSFDLAITGTHNTTFFGSQKTCSLFATLTPPSLSGPWQYTCSGGSGAIFTSSGTLNLVQCTDAM
jgi:hypothetical protein